MKNLILLQPEISEVNISIFRKQRFLINAVTFEPDMLETCNWPYFVHQRILRKMSPIGLLQHVWFKSYCNFRSKISRAPILRWVCGKCNCVKMVHATKEFLLDLYSRMSWLSFHINTCFSRTYRIAGKFVQKINYRVGRVNVDPRSVRVLF